MEENFGMPPGSEIQGGKAGEWVVFRWPAPGNFYERLGPDRAFWLAAAVCAPCAMIAWYFEPMYAVVFLFSMLFIAGASGGSWRVTGFEEMAFGGDAVMIRHGKCRGGVIPGVDQPAPQRTGKIRRKDLRPPAKAPGRGLLLSDGEANFCVGARLKAGDLDWLDRYIVQWAGM